MRAFSTNFRLTTNMFVVMSIMLLTAWCASGHNYEEELNFQPHHPTAAVPEGCWTGEAPKDVTIPGHVWATLPNGHTGVYGKRWTGKALDQVFTHKNVKGLTVIGFCR